jgi:hypothetical protein
MQRCQSQGGVEETDHLQKHVCTPMGGCYPESIRLQASRQQLMGCDKCGMTSSSTGVTQCTVLSAAKRWQSTEAYPFAIPHRLHASSPVRDEGD